MTIIVPAIVLIALVITGWIIFHIGYSAGYQDGGNAAMDGMAKRTEQQQREVI